MSWLAEPDFEKPLLYDNRKSPILFAEVSRFPALLGNTRHHITVVLTLVEEFCKNTD
jgi:hypothetical protein